MSPVLERICFGLWLFAVCGLIFLVLCFTTSITNGWMGMESMGPLVIVELAAATAALASVVLLRKIKQSVPNSGSWFSAAVYTVFVIYVVLVFLPLLYAVFYKLLHG